VHFSLTRINPGRQELSWRDIISGDARLAQDLQISLDATME
jgi:hypothetical protein